MEMYDLIAETYSDLFPLEVPKVDFLDRLFHRRSASVLDIGCATGDLAFALAKRGFRVLGIDLNAKMIEIAQKRNQKNVGNLEFRVLDMRNIGDLGNLDYALCLGNTLPHLPSLAGVRAFLTTLRSQLEPDGLIVAQVLNYDKILKNRTVEFQTVELESLSFARRYSFRENGGIWFEIEVRRKNDPTSLRDSTELLPLKKLTLIDLLTQAGFSKVETYADFTGRASTDDDFAVIYVASRRVLRRRDR